MGRGKTLRYADEAEMALVSEICELRIRERQIVGKLLERYTHDQLANRLKVEYQRRRTALETGEPPKRQWTRSEIATLAGCALDPRADKHTLFRKLFGKRSLESCDRHLYQFRAMKRSDVEALAEQEAC